MRFRGGFIADLVAATSDLKPIVFGVFERFTVVASQLGQIGLAPHDLWIVLGFSNNELDIPFTRELRLVDEIGMLAQAELPVNIEVIIPATPTPEGPRVTPSLVALGIPVLCIAGLALIAAACGAFYLVRRRASATASASLVRCEIIRRSAGSRTSERIQMIDEMRAPSETGLTQCASPQS